MDIQVSEEEEKREESQLNVKQFVYSTIVTAPTVRCWFSIPFRAVERHPFPLLRSGELELSGTSTSTTSPSFLQNRKMVY
jgi:hypothetical protein